MITNYFGIDLQEYVMEPKKLNVLSGSASNEDHAEAGQLVSELKTDLHEAEQCITGVKLHDVDWTALRDKALKLFAFIEKLAGVVKDSGVLATPSTPNPTPPATTTSHHVPDSHTPHGKRHK